MHNVACLLMRRNLRDDVPHEPPLRGIHHCRRVVQKDDDRSADHGKNGVRDDGCACIGIFELAFIMREGAFESHLDKKKVCETRNILKMLYLDSRVSILT